MQRLLLHSAFTLLYVMVVNAQQVVSKEHAPCNADGTNRITTLHVDSICSSNLICIQRAVARHLHRYHSEHVMVLEGYGRLLLGADTLHITAGDVIVIPQGTPHGVWCTSDVPVRVVSTRHPSMVWTVFLYSDTKRWRNATAHPSETRVGCGKALQLSTTPPIFQHFPDIWPETLDRR